MEKLLMAVYNGAKPKFTTYQFTEMINVGLVLADVKNAALLKLDDTAIRTLKDAGLSVTPYPLAPQLELVLVSKKDPGLNEKSTHLNVGKALSYLTPADINKSYNDSKFIEIEITFRHGKGNKLQAHLMTQKVINKSERQMMNYITPFVEAIKNMKLPSEFKILDIQVNVH